jgi:ribosome biogenesis GTPase / thiamine phosphate phosphatase
MSSNINKISLEDLGYGEYFESSRKALASGVEAVARVIAEYKEAYRVKDTNGEYLAKITGKQMFKAESREDYPAVGDWVIITEPYADLVVIQSVLPRKTILKRKYSNKLESQVIASNIDTAFIIESIDRDYNLNRFERYIALATDGRIKSAIVLNKIDLISESELNIKISQIKDRFKGIEVIPTSTTSAKGYSKLAAYIKKGETYCFLGSSGVGKSTLINRLLGENSIKTASISDHTGRGKHTTSSREMYFLENGGMVIDNPGMRQVGMTESDSGIDSVFDEIAALSLECKFIDCTHAHEPGCAVRAAVEAGTIDESKYENYLKLKKEAEFYEMTKLERREKDYKFGKFVKNVKKQMKGHKF